MKKLLSASAVAFLLLFSQLSAALTAGEDYALYQLTEGTPAMVRAAARNIVESGVTSHGVLDPLAETMLQNYTQSGDYIDAMAWAARAIGESGDARYHSTLTEIATTKGNRKVRGAAKKALKKLGAAAGTEQYTKGSVDLASVKSRAKSAYDQLVKKMQPEDGKESITIVEVGMSQGQIMARCGPPTSTTAYITGKSFIPFNFRGRDTVRTQLLYKGQGRVIVANSSAYSSNASAIEVIIDPSEVGYR